MTPAKLRINLDVQFKGLLPVNLSSPVVPRIGEHVFVGDTGYTVFAVVYQTNRWGVLQHIMLRVNPN